MESIVSPDTSLPRAHIKFTLFAFAEACACGPLPPAQDNLVARSFYEHHGFQVVERGFEEAWQFSGLKYSWSDHLRTRT